MILGREDEKTEQTYYPAIPAKASAIYLHLAASMEHAMAESSQTARKAGAARGFEEETLGMRRERKVVRWTAHDPSIWRAMIDRKKRTDHR